MIKSGQNQFLVTRMPARALHINLAYTRDSFRLCAILPIRDGYGFFLAIRELGKIACDCSPMLTPYKYDALRIRDFTLKAQQ